MGEPHKVYVADEVELAAIIAAVLKWVEVVPGLPRGNQDQTSFYWKVPRADSRAMFDPMGASAELPPSYSTPVDLYERDRVAVFGLQFRVWRKLP